MRRLVLLVLVAAGSLAVMVGRPSGEGRTREGDADARRYADELRPLLNDGARVVVLGIKPALTDYSLGKTEPVRLRVDADAWAAQLANIAERVARVDPPAALESAHAKYASALASYRSLALRFGEVAAAPLDARPAHVGELAAIGTAADRDYDDADALVERVVQD